MEKNKIIELNIEKTISEEKTEAKQKFNFSLQTNPILQKMFLTNMNNKKDKFKFKDLFR